MDSGEYQHVATCVSRVDSNWFCLEGTSQKLAGGLTKGTKKKRRQGLLCHKRKFRDHQGDKKIAGI